MLNRDQVLHVARLARLHLDEDELERMRRELSAVLDHVATISELDLEAVAPMSHAIEVAGALRADEPRPSLARAVVLADAPAASDEGFAVPTPGT